MTFYEHLRLAKGSAIKARREFMKERRWRDDEMWYNAWRDGLGDEVEQAIKKYLK